MKILIDRAALHFFGAFIISFSLTTANDIGFNGAVDASYGNSYDFYNFSENLLDLNFFTKMFKVGSNMNILIHQIWVLPLMI